MKRVEGTEMFFSLVYSNIIRSYEATFLELIYCF